MVLDLGRGSRRRYVLQQGDNCTTRVGTRKGVSGGWRVVAIDVGIVVCRKSWSRHPPPAGSRKLLVQNIFVSFGSMRF